MIKRVFLVCLLFCSTAFGVADFAYDGSKIVACNGTSGTPKTFADMHDADMAGTLSLHDRDSVSAVDGAAVAVDTALQPAEQLVLGGATGQDLYITAANWTNMTTTTIQITGTAADGAAQTEDIVITGNGTSYTTKFFKTVTHTQITVFTKTDAGSYDYELIQGRWGVVWEIVENAQYKIDCNIDFGDGTTSTYFTSKGGESVYGEDAAWFAVKANATLQLGEKVNGHSVNGATWNFSVEGDGASSFCFEGSILKLFGSHLTIRASDYFVNIWETEIREFTFSNIGAMDDIQILFYSEDTILSGQIYLCNFKAIRFLSSLAEINDVHFHHSIQGLVNHNSAITTTVKNLNITDATNDYIAGGLSGSNIITINPINNVSAPLIDTVENAWIKEQYTCNIHVADPLGNNLNGVTVATNSYGNVVKVDTTYYVCIEDHTSGTWATDLAADKWEITTNSAAQHNVAWVTGIDYEDAEQVFSVPTDPNGNIAEQTIDYKKWVGTNEAELTYSPHTFTYTKAGYAPLIKDDVTVDAPIIWHDEIHEAVGAFDKAWR